MKNYLKKPLISLILIFILVSLACNVPTGTNSETSNQAEAQQVVNEPGGDEESSQATQEAQGEEGNVVAVDVGSVYPPPFAEYPEVKVELPAEFSGGYSLPVDLGGVQGLDEFEFNAQERDRLSQNGFFVEEPVPGEIREFYQIYERSRYSTVPVFITTDSVLHIYHLIFDKMLRDLERDTFISTLESLTSTMQAASLEQYDALRGTELEEPALRNLAYFTVVAQLLEMNTSIDPAVVELVNPEISLLEAHDGVAISTIWDRDDLADDQKLIEDYSQYVPRGHYTRSAELERYFKAMMWYGRLTFRLKDDFETQRALLLVEAMRNSVDENGVPAAELWQRIYEPTAFLVGKADDLSYREYGQISDAVFGNNPELISFADETLLAQFVETAKQLPPPQVNSMWVWIWEDKEEATSGFRFMGQRFTLDAYVFGQMIWREVGTLDNPRDLPKGLDFFASMGSDEAYDILVEMGENNYENFDTQMQKVKEEVASLEMDSWTQNVYWSWLYAFHPLIEVKGASFPAFMQTQAWTRKDLNTALGSWTELKHDTILYAKQVMAEMGGGPGDEYPPHGYVEPNPEAYARLYALSEMTYSGLDARGILSDTTRANLENLMDMLTFLQSIAERELSGGEITDDEYWRMKYYGGELEALTLAAADLEEEFDRDLSDQKAALVADVATGMERVLEEAIGQPTRIYVVLPDEPYRIGLGAVFSYYEFVVAPGDRMTDETWQAMVESGTEPDLPEWTNLFYVP